MLCHNCQKKNATVHLTEVDHQNVKNEIHLCEECARKKGLTVKLQFSLSELLSGLIEPVMGTLMKEEGDLACPKCGMTYWEFKNKARLGCAEDYEVFKKGLVPLLEKIHGSTQHYGKIPSTVSPELARIRELKELQRELEKLVKVEEFEKAAKVRDKIKELKTSDSGKKTKQEETK